MHRRVFPRDLNGITVESNAFTHLEEGFHVLCYGENSTGSTSPSWNNFTAKKNDFNNIHRIAAEDAAPECDQRRPPVELV